MDRIFIKNLSLEARVGVSERERTQSQTILVDVSVFCDLKRAGDSDNPSMTLSYSKLKNEIADFVSSREFRLVEGIAEGIALLVLQKKRRALSPTKVRVRVRKKKYSFDPGIGVEITRENAA
jgi:7,8-dihydroneopterin aldolase/epimerase/oxygenase